MAIYYECDMCQKRFPWSDAKTVSKKIYLVTFTNSDGYTECEFDLCIKCYEELKKQFLERRKEMYEKNRQNVYLE